MFGTVKHRLLITLHLQRLGVVLTVLILHRFRAIVSALWCLL